MALNVFLTFVSDVDSLTRIFDYLICDNGFVGLISYPPGSAVIPVVTATKRRRVFFLWHDLRGDINASLYVALGFLAVFQFFVPNFLNFSTIHFPSLSPTPNHYFELLPLQISCDFLRAGAFNG